MNPSKNSSSSPQPSVVFTCPENPELASYPYAQKLQRHRLQGILIDTHLQVGDKKHPAHRVVLSSSSPVLEAKLSENWDPERKEICELGDDVIDPNIVEDLLDFFYIRKVTITMANAKQLWIAANYLDLPTLMVGTERFLTDHFSSSPDYAFDVYNFATMYELNSLRKSCTKFVFENYAIVLKSEKLLDFPEDFLMQLLEDLKDFESNIVNRAMFQLLIKWVKFDRPTRSDSLLNFLKMFPFREVSEKFITNTILEEEMIIDSQDCLELVKDSLFINELSSLLKGKLVYCVGKSVLHLDAAGKWTEKSPMINKRNSGFCSVSSGDKIYIFGGGVGGSNIVEVFDTKHDRWTQLPPMPADHDFAAAVTMNGYIYVSGGLNQRWSKQLCSMDRYCVATKEWTSMAPMLKIRVSTHKMVAFNDFIFAIGGDREGDKETVEKYSPEANQWEMVPAFDLRKGDFTVLHHEKFFTFNLRREHLIDNVDTVNIYDPLTDSTETFQDSGAVAVLNVGGYLDYVSVGDKIWAFNYRDKIFGEFDPVTRKWKKIDTDMSVLHSSYYQVVVPQR